MEFLISVSVCERIRLCKALTALVAGAGEALWAKEVTGGIGLWGCSESRVVESGKCWAHAGTAEQKGSRGSGGKGRPIGKAAAWL